MSDLTESFSQDRRSFINIDTYETVEQSPKYIRSSNGNGYVCRVLLLHFLLLLLPGVKYLRIRPLAFSNYNYKLHNQYRGLTAA